MLICNPELAGNLVKLADFPSKQAETDAIMEIGGETQIADGEVTIAMTTAVHSSSVFNPKAGANEPERAYGGNPAGFIIAIKNGPTIYHSGDTAYFKDMETIGDSYSIDVALRRIMSDVKALRGYPIRLFLIFVGTVLLVCGSDRTSSGQTALAQLSKRAPCTAPEFRQFDFWIGDWDTFELNDSNKVVARNHVESILDGCVLREIYEQLDGLIGQSFTIYDAARKVWHQSWVTNRGQLLILEGGMQGEQMILTGIDTAANGKPVMLRGVWVRVEGSVRETAETSGDSGKTWKPLFDIVFRPHKP